MAPGLPRRPAGRAIGFEGVDQLDEYGPPPREGLKLAGDPFLHARLIGCMRHSASLKIGIDAPVSSDKITGTTGRQAHPVPDLEQD